jgi:hypothetical protein
VQWDLDVKESRTPQTFFQQKSRFLRSGGKPQRLTVKLQAGLNAVNICKGEYIGGLYICQQKQGFLSLPRANSKKAPS